MKRIHSSTEEDVVYFGDCENAGPMDDMVGLLAMLCIERRLACDADWSQLFSLRAVSRWWSHVIGASLVAEHVCELNLLDVKPGYRLYWWCDAIYTFSSLHTLAIDATHPLSNHIAEMTTLRSLTIDGWIQSIENMENLERLAVLDIHDRWTGDQSILVIPPRNLKTLVLLDHYLAYDIRHVHSAMPHLRRLVLTIGTDGFDRDHLGDRVRALIPQLEEVRWYVTYFEPYDCILNDFRRGIL